MSIAGITSLDRRMTQHQHHRRLPHYHRPTVQTVELVMAHGMWCLEIMEQDAYLMTVSRHSSEHMRGLHS